MTETNPKTQIETRDLNRTVPFSLAPDAAFCAALADELDIRGVRKLRFDGELRPSGDRDLELNARLGVTVVQDCVVTLEPVTTRIDEDVTRIYLANMPDPEGEEAEMPEDDTQEQKPAQIDLNAVMAEAVALALPAFPRAEGVEPVELSVTEPGKAPLTDDDVKPFAALKSLRDKLDDTDGEKG